MRENYVNVLFCLQGRRHIVATLYFVAVSENRLLSSTVLIIIFNEMGNVKIGLSDVDLYPDYQKASHVLLYARTEKLSVTNESRRAIVLVCIYID